MSQAAKAQEPSMEEILASIRRIIADDDTSKPAPPPRPVPLLAARDARDGFPSGWFRRRAIAGAAADPQQEEAPAALADHTDLTVAGPHGLSQCLGLLARLLGG